MWNEGEQGTAAFRMFLPVRRLQRRKEGAPLVSADQVVYEISLLALDGGGIVPPFVVAFPQDPDLFCVVQEQGPSSIALAAKLIRSEDLERC